MAFSVVRLTSKTAANKSQVLGWEMFSVDIQSEMDLLTGELRNMREGIYMNHISAASYENRYMGISLRWYSYSCSAGNQVSVSMPDIMPETSGVAWLSYYIGSGIISYMTDYPVYSDSTGFQTSWSMFRLNELIQPLVAFGVALIDYTTYHAPNVLPLDRHLVDAGNGWDENRNVFIVPVSGIYFLSFTTMSNEDARHRVEIQVNQVPLMAVSLTNTQQHMDTNSNSVLASLSTGDIVRAFISQGSVYSFCDGVSFMGFLYEPIHGIKVAWSVHRTTSAVGPLEPVSFDYVMVNVGCSWNNASSSVTVPVSGVYYLHINTGKVPTKKVNFQVMWNGNPYINFFTEYTYHDGTETRGRAIMTNLTQGDSLHIKLWNGTEVYSDIYKQTSFSGFLIYPNI